jgi:DNA-binding transcriptional LysR family regulator
MATLAPPQLPDLASLQLLVLIADRGSIAAGAALTGISQPSASKRIRLLERHLGVPLLERGVRGSQLTEHGRTVVAWARAVVESAQTLVVGAQALRAGAAAGVSTVASQTIAEYLFPHWLARARELSISVQLRVTNSAGVIELVRAHEVELGFVETPTVPRDLAGKVVATDRLVVVVGPDHPFARRRTPVAASDLAATQLVMREGGSGTRATLERALQNHAHTHLELDSNAAVKVVVSSGTGVAVLSTLAVAGELADGRLVEVPTQGLDLRRALRAVWPRGRRLLGAAAEFLAATR